MKTIESHCEQCNSLQIDVWRVVNHSICAVCGISFVPYRKEQYCCSSDCGNRAKSMKLRNDGKVTKISKAQHIMILRDLQRGKVLCDVMMDMKEAYNWPDDLRLKAQRWYEEQVCSKRE